MTSEERALFDQKMSEEISRLIADTQKLNDRNSYYPLILWCGATLALIAIVKLFL